MIPPEVCYPQLSIKQELNPNHMKNDKQTEQKPKKVNSEMRKQQNRIASRNYREKRKRKLQYLQKLLQDESTNEQQRGSESPQPSEKYLSPASIDYEYSDFTPSPSIEPLDFDFTPGYPIRITMPTGTSTVAFEDHSVLTPPYHEQYWQPSLYDTTPGFDIPAWNASTWAYNTPCEITHGAFQPDPFSYPTPDPCMQADLITLSTLPSPSPQAPHHLTPLIHSYTPQPPFKPSIRYHNPTPTPLYVNPPFLTPYTDAPPSPYNEAPPSPS